MIFTLVWTWISIAIWKFTVTFSFNTRHNSVPKLSKVICFLLGFSFHLVPENGFKCVLIQGKGLGWPLMDGNMSWDACKAKIWKHPDSVQFHSSFNNTTHTCPYFCSWDYFLVDSMLNPIKTQIEFKMSDHVLIKFEFGVIKEDFIKLNRENQMFYCLIVSFYTQF